MGTIQNHALLVTASQGDRLDADVEKIKAFARERTEPICSAMDDLVVVVPGVVNFYATVIMAPDGSKEGWSTSDRGDEIRAFFIETMSHWDTVIEVQWGDYGTSLNGERVS